MGRKGVWGGRGYGAAAEGSLERKGVWGGREAGAEGSFGRKGAWGGREYGADGGREAASGLEKSLGRKGDSGGRRPASWTEGRLGRKVLRLPVGRKGASGGMKAGPAEGSLGRTGGWGGLERWGGRHAPTTKPPLAPSSHDLSQPAGSRLRYWRLNPRTNPPLQSHRCVRTSWRGRWT